MNTIIDKNYEGLKRIDNGDYFYDGNLIINGNLDIQLDDSLIVRGFVDVRGYIKVRVSIKAGEDIKAKWFIEAGEYIKAGKDIEAKWFIEAGEYIEAGKDIKAGDAYGIKAGLRISCKGKLSCGLKVFAGICTWGVASEKNKTITCSKFEGGEVAYGILKETASECFEKRTN